MRAAHRTAGFSLVEMLLAVFILGIGVISISALFPAGIALQRQATDDTVGPIVAKNALATIRAKLSQDDFGSFQQFGVGTVVNPSEYAGIVRTSNGDFVPQLDGDWSWMRPGFLFGSATNSANAGTIDVFSSNLTRRGLVLPNSPGQLASEISPDGYPASSPVLWGIPYNLKKYPLYSRHVADPAAVASLGPVSQRLLEPVVTFSQAERAWPQLGASEAPPQYYWDCMFRRNGGRVQVAVFVYRVTAPGGDPRPYSVQRSSAALVGTPPPGTMIVSTETPPMPMVYYAPNPGTANSWPNRTAVNPPVDDTIPNTGPGTPFGAGRTWDDWMAPAQIWIDNHGNQHEVLRGRLVAGTAASAFPNQGPVKLQRRIPINPRAPIYGTAPNVNNDTGAASFHAFVEAIWFVPNADAAGNVITPIYVTVEEL